MSPSSKNIQLKGAETNNLKAIDVAFPLGQVTVVTGVSGSGKSSLVFDTLYGESYRRYVESLSSFARQYLKALPKPQVQTVENLPPSIAVKQQRSGASNRSTVGTATELTDLLRVLFTHLATVYCHSCGHLVEKDTPESVAHKVLSRWPGLKVLLVAPLARWGKIGSKDLKSQLEAQGFTRLLLAEGAPRVVKLAEAKAADLKGAGVVVDRVTVSADSQSRIREAVQLAFKVGRGLLSVVPDDTSGDGSTVPAAMFSEELECPDCGIAYAEPSMSLFSHNHPQGACPKCQGFGLAADLDWDKVVPDKTSSLAKHGVAAWNFGGFTEYYEWAKVSAAKRRMDVRKPFDAYSESDWNWLKSGEDRNFDGVKGFFSYLDSKKYKAHYRIHASRFRKYIACDACHGDRINQAAAAARLGSSNFAEAHRKTLEELTVWLALVESEARGSEERRGIKALMGVAEAIDEAKARLGYLQRVGVSYLPLNRSARTLSGGELQRINMARCLGSALTDTLFCLDEPSSGLHARDSAQLLSVIRELGAQGNTVVMVEHERQLIEASDHMIEIGPKAGHEGGHVVYAGRPRPPLSQSTEAFERPFFDEKKHLFIQLSGARTHNLKNVTARFPVGAITAVCGVSGSGKTSLIQHTLYPMMARALGQNIDRQGGIDEPLAEGLGPERLLVAHADVVLVSQAGLGRSQRSNIATYLGIMDEIRKMLAAQPMAKKLGLTAGAFSFNTPGGRCETCRGLGTVVEDLSFLGEMDVSCPTCEGRRFKDEVLSVEWNGRNLLGILGLTVSEARTYFYERPSVKAACDVVIGMGLGYVTLGQSTSSFSGGEAQRLKLLSLMQEAQTSRPSCLILDEPTTGLSDSDVAALLKQLSTLARKGHTVIVVEHHLDVLRACDWLIEVGPEAAHRGGQIIYQGPPLQIGQAHASVTAPFLLDRHHKSTSHGGVS